MRNFLHLRSSSIRQARTLVFVTCGLFGVALVTVLATEGTENLSSLFLPWMLAIAIASINWSDAQKRAAQKPQSTCDELGTTR